MVPKREGCGEGDTPSPPEGPSLCPRPEKNANYMQKRLSLVHIFVTTIVHIFVANKIC